MSARHPWTTRAPQVSRQSGPWVILDADDTLWSTQPLYNKAKDEFVGLLSNIPLSGAQIIDQLDEIDTQAAQDYGFGRERFTNSMTLLYRMLCAEFDEPVDSSILTNIADIGQSVFERAPIIYSGVGDALCRLQEVYGLALLTKGDHSVQLERIAQSGLESYFDRIYIVPSKNTATYSEVLTDVNADLESTWAVGNSARSDINPALALGLRGVLVPNHSWRYEMAELLPGDVAVAGSLTEAADLILRTLPGQAKAAL